ncbi:VPLPA-CTERM sorting domain-containing protein, partial [bacterium]|nr:VPLPA-CTERM sorting domain-containing protein [bacterium]
NVASNITNQGTIESNNGTLVLNGTASNTSSGLISTESGSQVLVLQGLASNEGIISLTGGTFDNNNKVLNNEGQISGHGTLRTGGLTNTDAVHFTGGATTINGNVTNEVGASMQVSYDAAIFTGDVVNNGIFKTTDTNVTFAGSYTENGIYISDPSDNYFQDLLIGENGSLVGGVGDNWHVSGDLINASTQASSWNTNDASLFMSGAGNQLLELSAEDLGASLLGYDDNFAWGELHVGSGIDLTLADGNAEEGGALYVGLFNYGGPVDFSAFVMAAIFSDYNIYYDADLAGNSYLMGNTFALNGSGSLIGISSVPVPAAAWLFGSALAGLLVARRKNNK